MNCLAIIPARGGSKRIPLKNVRQFAGLPILHYPIRAALLSQCFAEVMVSTDNAAIASEAIRAGAQVPFLRSAKNSDDYATTADVLIEVLEQYQLHGKHYSTACCIYPVAVLVTPGRLREGLSMLYSMPWCNGVVPVLKFGYPIQRALRLSGGFLEMMDPRHLNSRSQDLEPTYHDAGQYYWFRVEALMRERTLLGPGVLPMILGEMEAQDIDTEDDWRLAEVKYELQGKSPCAP